MSQGLHASTKTLELPLAELRVFGTIHDCPYDASAEKDRNTVILHDSLHSEPYLHADITQRIDNWHVSTIYIKDSDSLMLAIHNYTAPGFALSIGLNASFLDALRARLDFVPANQ